MKISQLIVTVACTKEGTKTRLSLYLSVSMSLSLSLSSMPYYYTLRSVSFINFGFQILSCSRLLYLLMWSVISLSVKYMPRLLYSVLSLIYCTVGYILTTIHRQAGRRELFFFFLGWWGKEMKISLVIVCSRTVANGWTDWRLVQRTNSAIYVKMPLNSPSVSLFNY